MSDFEERSIRPSSSGGSTVGNFVLFTICFVLFCGGLYLMSLVTLDNVWIFAAGMVMSLVAFAIPFQFTGRGDHA